MYKQSWKTSMHKKKWTSLDRTCKNCSRKRMSHKRARVQRNYKCSLWLMYERRLPVVWQDVRRCDVLAVWLFTHTHTPLHVMNAFLPHCSLHWNKSLTRRTPPQHFFENKLFTCFNWVLFIYCLVESCLFTFVFHNAWRSVYLHNVIKSCILPLQWDEASIISMKNLCTVQRSAAYYYR